MITIIEWNTRQQFESKKLAAEYFEIPIWLVNKSIANNSTVSYRKNGVNQPLTHKKYKFSESWGNSGVTRTLNPSKTIPFGKYKGKKPNEVPLGYLLWMFKKTECPRCVTDALKEVKNLLS